MREMMKSSADTLVTITDPFSGQEKAVPAGDIRAGDLLAPGFARVVSVWREGLLVLIEWVPTRQGQGKP